MLTSTARLQARAGSSARALPASLQRRQSRPHLPPPPRRQQQRARRRILPAQAAQKQTFKSFDDMIQNSSEPVLVDFYATWCGPCQMMSNILSDVAPQLRGQVKVVKIDTEKYPNLAGQYNIGALPTLMLFKNGKPVDRIEGVLMADQLKQRLQYFLAKS